MGQWLGVVCLLGALLSPVCFSSIVFNKNVDAANEDVVRVKDNSLTPTNFTMLAAVGTVSLTTTAGASASQVVQDSSVVLFKSSTAISSLEPDRGGKLSTVGVATPTSSRSTESQSHDPMATSKVNPAVPSASIPPPGSSYSPPNNVPVSSNHQSLSSSSITHYPLQTSGYTPPSISPTATGCAPPVTVTISGPYCSTTPTPPAPPCTSDCSSKIGLSLGISIPGTAIFTFLLTALSCLCCQRVKKKQSYIQLAPTVYFDEEEHD